MNVATWVCLVLGGDDAVLLGLTLCPLGSHADSTCKKLFHGWGYHQIQGRCDWICRIMCMLASHAKESPRKASHEFEKDRIGHEAIVSASSRPAVRVERLAQFNRPAHLASKSLMLNENFKSLSQLRTLLVAAVPAKVAEDSWGSWTWQHTDTWELGKGSDSN